MKYTALKGNNLVSNEIQGAVVENFPIVLALCRAAMKEPSAAVIRHVQRLSEALVKSGNTDEAGALDKLLKSAQLEAKIEPSRAILSRSFIFGEVLTENVAPPVDRETSAPLANIKFPAQLNVQLPIFSPSLNAAVERMLEEWNNSESLISMGIRPPYSCLLFGAPGTGKTQLAQYVAKRLGLPLVIARLDGLISSFLGTTARNISALFDFANRYKCVLLLDEFDAIAKVRDDPHELGEIKRVVNTLLQCLDMRSTKGFTLAITNHESLLDMAVWRRFDVRISVPKPDLEARLIIVKNYITPLDISEQELKLLAWATEGFSGADIETLANSLKRASAMEKNSSFNLIKSLENYFLLSADTETFFARNLFMGSRDELMKTLKNTGGFFSQKDIAKLFNVGEATISRLLRQAS
ncbi:MAG: ATP-binding protein [Pseudomonadota bacterium]